jgi:RNA polymerase sigma-70 factor (ECF subfamily)
METSWVLYPSATLQLQDLYIFGMPEQSTLSGFNCKNPSIRKYEKMEKLDPKNWVSLYGDALFRYVLARCPNREIAEDLVQETFLAALDTKDSFSGHSSEKTWLFGILKHKLADYYRSANREHPDGLLQGTDEEAEFFDSKGRWRKDRRPEAWAERPDSVLEKSEFWQIFERCLASLPSPLKDVFQLRELEKITGENSCELLQISPENLWVRLHRAKLRLRYCLEKNYFKT